MGRAAELHPRPGEHHGGEWRKQSTSGILPLNGWWTRIDGYVFNDTNRNGIKDAGEPGLPGYTLTIRKRENSLMDRGATAVVTDAGGHYVVENAYPMTQWLVWRPTTTPLHDGRHLPGRQPAHADHRARRWRRCQRAAHHRPRRPHRLGHARLRPRTAARTAIDPDNGGIVGTVSYDTTRNELDPRYAAVEDWQPGISGLTVKLYTPVACSASTTGSLRCDGSV